MLKIRLARVGKKKKPTYRFVVSESARDMYGRSLEILGHYNPFSKVIEVNKERILYWISKGAQVSPTVHNLLVDQNVISGDKVKASKSKKKKKKGGEEEKPEDKKEAKPADVSSDSASVATSAKEAAPSGAKEEEVKPEEAKAKEKTEEKKPASTQRGEEEPKKEEVKEEKPAEQPKPEEKKKLTRR